MPDCPECKDESRFVTGPYKPFCKIIQNSVPREKFERFCKRYPQYRECDIYKRKWR